MARNLRKMRKNVVKWKGVNSATGLPWRFRAPREMRIVSSITVGRNRANNSRVGAVRERVPQIRLSGTWLECVGFERGSRFLVLADVPNQILLVLTEP